MPKSFDQALRDNRTRIPVIVVISIVGSLVILLFIWRIRKRTTQRKDDARAAAGHASETGLKDGTRQQSLDEKRPAPSRHSRLPRLPSLIRLPHGGWFRHSAGFDHLPATETQKHATSHRHHDSTLTDHQEIELDPHDNSMYTGADNRLIRLDGLPAPERARTKPCKRSSQSTYTIQKDLERDEGIQDELNTINTSPAPGPSEEDLQQQHSRNLAVLSERPELKRPRSVNAVMTRERAQMQSPTIPRPALRQRSMTYSAGTPGPAPVGPLPALPYAPDQSTEKQAQSMDTYTEPNISTCSSMPQVSNPSDAPAIHSQSASINTWRSTIVAETAPVSPDSRRYRTVSGTGSQRSSFIEEEMPSENQSKAKGRRLSRRRSNVDVSSTGSPARHKKRMVLRDEPPQSPSDSGKVDSPASHVLDTFRQYVLNSPARRPSILKGSPGSKGSRKGHQRKNCVRISTRSHTVLGPSNDLGGISEEVITEDACPRLQASSTRSSRFRPLSQPQRSSKGPLDLIKLRASLTPSSPTLNLARYETDQSLSNQFRLSGGVRADSTPSKRHSLLSRASSLLSIPSLPSIDQSLQVTEPRPTPTFEFTRPSGEYERRTGFPFDFDPNPHDEAGMPWSPPRTEPDDAEYNPEWIAFEKDSCQWPRSLSQIRMSMISLVSAASSESLEFPFPDGPQIFCSDPIDANADMPRALQPAVPKKTDMIKSMSRASRSSLASLNFPYPDGPHGLCSDPIEAIPETPPRRQSRRSIPKKADIIRAVLQNDKENIVPARKGSIRVFSAEFPPLGAKASPARSPSKASLLPQSRSYTALQQASPLPHLAQREHSRPFSLMSRASLRGPRHRQPKDVRRSIIELRRSMHSDVQSSSGRSQGQYARLGSPASPRPPTHYGPDDSDDDEDPLLRDRRPAEHVRIFEDPQPSTSQWDLADELTYTPARNHWSVHRAAAALASPSPSVADFALQQALRESVGQSGNAMPPAPGAWELGHEAWADVENQAGRGAGQMTLAELERFMGVSPTEKAPATPQRTMKRALGGTPGTGKSWYDGDGFLKT